MKRHLFLFSLILLASPLFFSCGNSGKNGSDSTDSTSRTVTSAEVANPNIQGGEKSVYGVTMDRAMNSIVLLTQKGDTITFGYANVDDRHNFASSNIGDSVTVKYVVVHDKLSLYF